MISPIQLTFELIVSATLLFLSCLTKLFLEKYVIGGSSPSPQSEEMLTKEKGKTSVVGPDLQKLNRTLRFNHISHSVGRKCGLFTCVSSIWDPLWWIADVKPWGIKKFAILKYWKWEFPSYLREMHLSTQVLCSFCLTSRNGYVSVGLVEVYWCGKGIDSI